ncbi:MAG: hypothetical protein HY348_06690 [Nitrospira defluvii]|nr:hypothetical protein [Nitrospira defluvii]
MNRMVIVILAVIVVATGACVSKPPKKQFQRLAGEFISPVHITKPVDQQSAVIGITINTDKWSPNTEDRVYLVKVENERDLFQGTNLIPTNILVPPLGGGGSGTVYVQNVPPGRYAAVAFTTSEKGFGKVREVTLFLLPKDMVKQTDTTVAAGGISFMGEYDMGLSTMVIQEKAADDVQMHYFEVFWGKPLAQVIADFQVLGTPAYFAVHSVALTKASRDANAQEWFLSAAKRDLEPSWTPVIERRPTSVK